MEYSDYLRDEAAKYRAIAENNEDPLAKKEFLEQKYAKKSPMISTIGARAADSNTAHV